jgi:dTDP-4-dehydrorhamnose reductase
VELFDMRCLILGATGQIGSHLAAACAYRGLAHLGTYYRWPHPEYAPLDVRDGDAVDELVADYLPDATFLATGLICGGYAEAFPDECRQIAVEGARLVADAVGRHGGSLVLFSSDEVFGECVTARREEDPVSPVGVLARCHAEAEAIVRETLPGRHLIVRTGWVYGPEERRRNRGCRLAKRLAAGEPVEAATDRHGQPTYGPDLAEATLELARLGQTGTVHVVGPDRHTEFTFARLAAHVLGCDVDLVRGLPAAEFADDPRPSRVWLDRFKLRTLLGPRAVRGAADGLRALRAEMFPATARTARAA